MKNMEMKKYLKKISNNVQNSKLTSKDNKLYYLNNKSTILTTIHKFLKIYK